MAEPFGIASLSIEACKALVSYCDGWRAFDTEIDSVKMKAEGLLSTLQILDKLLNGAHAINPDIAADITLKISQTETWLTKVNNQVAKCSVIQKSSAVDQKLRETAKKAKYPFRRETLKSAANDLRDIQINLNTALLALQIQQAESLRNVEVLEASSMTKIEQYGSRFDKMELAIQGYYIQSQSQLQIASKYPAQRRPASHRYQNTERTKWVRFASRWLRLSVELMVTIENGTQGFALSPTLRFRGIVSKNSPAFNLIRQITRKNCSPQQNAEISNQAIRSLQRIFDEGRASPGDQTQDGETLITALYIQIFVWHANSLHLGFQPYYPILRYLIDKGCPIENPIENASNFPMDLISLIISCLMFTHMADIGSVITKVTEIGFQVTDRNLLGVDSQHFRLAFIHNEESFMISDVTRAILSQSETELKGVIASGDVSSDEYRLCWMCLSWAPGLAILLEFMSAVGRYELDPVLRDAVRHGCPESVKLLLDYGSPISNSTIWACHSTETKGRIVFDAFIARRKHLLELARTMLPESSQEELRLEPGLLPDSNAGEIHAQLNQHNILVPLSLQPYIHTWDYVASVFHGPTLSVDDMEFLYTAGFRDIDALDSKGYTPISRAYLRYRDKQSTGEYIERIKWLMRKGARLHSPPTITGSVPSHHISRNITYLLSKTLRLTPETSIEGPHCLWSKSIGTHNRDPIGLVYGSGHTDNCCCSCSVAGCIPISVALRVILGGPWKYGWKYGPTLWLSKKEKACILQQHLLEIPSFAAAAHDVLRLITFTDLGLTHTCCRFNRTREGIIDIPFEKEEAAEIQDEERLFLLDFEQLLDDIIREYDQLRIPLLEYIRTRWCRRVREYLWKNGEKVDSQSLCNYLDPDFARQWDESMTHARSQRSQ